MRKYWFILLLLVTLPVYADSYQSIAITAPEDGVTFFPYQTDINIEFKVTPRINAGKKHQAVIRVNGEVVQKGRATRHTLFSPNRGTYYVSAEIQDARGKVLIKSDEVMFHVKRHRR